MAGRRGERRWRLAAVAAVAALLAAAPAVPAATPVALDPVATWGTGPAELPGHAQKVTAVLEAHGLVYLGGEFTEMVPPGAQRAEPGQARGHLAALDAASGELSAWHPDADGNVRALALSPDGRRLYVGGNFRRIGGQVMRGLAAVDPLTGALDPTFRPGAVAPVFALAVSPDGARLYAGGSFTEVTVPEGQPGAGVHTRPGLAAFDATTGALLDWAPPEQRPGAFVGHRGEPDETIPGEVTALAVSGDGTALHVGGTFIDFGGRSGLLTLDTATAQPAPWQAAVDRPIFGLAMSPVDGRTLFAATGGSGGRLLALDPGEAPEPRWYVQVDGDAVAVVASASTVYLLGHYDFIVPKGSSCTRHCPEGEPRGHVAAFDAVTGALDPWNPLFNTDTGPYTGAQGAERLYVGGEFARVNDQKQPGLAAFPGAP